MVRGDSCVRGFTLIEMIVVLALISIMLFIGLPAFRDNLFDSSLKSTSRKVIGFVKGVRELAVRERQSYYLYIDMIDQSLRFSQDPDKPVWMEPMAYSKQTQQIPTVPESEKEAKREKTGHQDQLVFPDGVRIFEVQTADSGKIAEGEKKIWISQKGYMEQMVLHLEDRNKKIFSLHFQPFLENVTLYETYTPIP